MGGEAYASSEMIDHAARLREFCALFEGMSPGATAFGNCGSLFAHLRRKKFITGGNPTRHFLRIQQPSGDDELDNVNGLPGTGHHADGRAKVESD